MLLWQIYKARILGYSARYYMKNEMEINHENACVVTNPPYGERLLDVQQAKTIYKLLGKVLPKGNISIITPDKDFEILFGRKADKRRKLYNGKIQCQLYMYF